MVLLSHSKKVLGWNPPSAALCGVCMYQVHSGYSGFLPQAIDKQLGRINVILCDVILSVQPVQLGFSPETLAVFQVKKSRQTKRVWNQRLNEDG